MPLRHVWVVVLALLAACGASNEGLHESSCPAGRTKLDGVCVSDSVADYVGCVRAQGATLGEERGRKLSAEAGVAGTHAAIATEVSDKLAKSYSASDANTLEVIRGCSQLRSETSGAASCAMIGVKCLACGFESDTAFQATCEGAPKYAACLRAAGDDCQAIALCGFEHMSVTMCAGGGKPAGSTSCKNTLDCLSKCDKNTECECRCTAALDPARSLNAALPNQCFMLHCARCGEAGKPSCNECASSNCGEKFRKWCAAN